MADVMARWRGERGAWGEAFTGCQIDILKFALPPNQPESLIHTQRLCKPELSLNSVRLVTLLETPREEKCLQTT